MDKALIVIVVIVALFILGNSSTQPAPSIVPDTQELTPTDSVVTENKNSSDTSPQAPSPTGSAEGMVRAGEEGTFLVERTSSDVITVSEGQSNSVLALAIQAKGSNVYIQRVRVDLGVSKDIWLKVFKTLYVVDDNYKVLAEVPLTKSTISSTNGRYSVNLEGFNYAIKKETTGRLYIKADSYPDIDMTGSSYVLTVPKNGIRAQDERPSQVYGPVTNHSVTIKI